MPELGNIQPFRLRQLGLAFVKGSKPRRFEFERTGYVQAVQSTHSQLRPVLPP
jgi:hypothetical protein